MKRKNFISKAHKTLLEIGIFLCALFTSCVQSPHAVYGYDIISVEIYDDEVPYTLVQESRRTGKDGPGRAAASYTTPHYDLSKVKKMTSTFWTTSGGSHGGSSGTVTSTPQRIWYNGSNQPIPQLNVSDEVNVEALARTVDLTDCYCVASVGFDFVASGWVEAGVQIIITSGIPTKPVFTGFPNGNLTLVGKSQKICALIAILTIKTHIQSAFIQIITDR